MNIKIGALAIAAGLVGTVIFSQSQQPSSMPDLGGAVGWLNSGPLTAKSLRGKVVLVNFWTYTCINSLLSRCTGYVEFRPEHDLLHWNRGHLLGRCTDIGSSSLLLQTRRRAAKKRFEFCHLRPPRLRPNNLTSDGKGRIAKASGIRRMTEIRGVPRATKMRKSQYKYSSPQLRGCDAVVKLRQNLENMSGPVRDFSTARQLVSPVIRTVLEIVKSGPQGLRGRAWRVHVLWLQATSQTAVTTR